MRALIVSDIHSNTEALDAVIADAQDRGGFDSIWCLGDMVGYGPDPSLTLRRLWDFDLVAVAGNHDYAAAGVIDAADFNGAAYAAIRWTADQLDNNEKRFLSGLPTVSLQTAFTLVHGSLRAPIEEYLLHPTQAQATLQLLTTPYCLVGHSHQPFLCREMAPFPVFLPLTEGVPSLLGDVRTIINPGSVGQPRDRDTRASYAIFDSGVSAIEHYRVEYDIAATQDKMRRAGLPGYLAERLSHGA